MGHQQIFLEAYARLREKTRAFVENNRLAKAIKLDIKHYYKQRQSQK